MQLDTKALAGKRVLVVDDEGSVRQTLCRLLMNNDCKVVEANNGAEALSIFRGTHFDLVMTDFEMPFLKGDELATKIKAVAPAQPILMVTAYDQRRGAHNPVDAVLKKPFNCSGLLATMTELLSRPCCPPRSFRTPEINLAETRSRSEVLCA